MKPTRFVLRAYQKKAVDTASKLLSKGENVLLESPVGSGKTVMGVFIAKALKARTLFLAHRVELLQQVTAVSRESGVKLQAVSVQKMASTNVDLRPHIDLIIIDECHRTQTTTYQRILARAKGIPVLGITATPMRNDDRSLMRKEGGTYDTHIVASTISELIAQKVIFNPRVYAASQPDLSGIARATSGDFAVKQLEKVINTKTLNGDVVAHYKQLTAPESALVFCTSLAHAIILTQRFQAESIDARMVASTTFPAKRKALMHAFKLRKFPVLINVDVCTEGWDWPQLECVILATATLSPIRYAQMIGRAMRTAPLKKRPAILDHGNNCFMHGMPDSQRWQKPSTKKIEGFHARVKACPSCKQMCAMRTIECECGHIFEEDEGFDKKFQDAAEEAPAQLLEIAPQALGRGFTVSKDGCWLAPTKHVFRGLGSRYDVAVSAGFDRKLLGDPTKAMQTFCRVNLCCNPYHLWRGRDPEDIKKDVIAFRSYRTKNGCLELPFFEKDGFVRFTYSYNRSRNYLAKWPDTVGGGNINATVRKMAGIGLHQRIEMTCGNDNCIEISHIKPLKRMRELESGLDYHVSSGNVFADLGFADADLLLKKAKLAIKFNRELARQKLSQKQAAEILTVRPTTISALACGELTKFSIKRLKNLVDRITLASSHPQQLETE